MKWCGQVFTSVPPTSILIDLYADTLPSLEPSLNTCFDAALKEEAEPLILLLELSQCTQYFVSNLEAAIESSFQSKSSYLPLCPDILKMKTNRNSIFLKIWLFR